MLGTTAIIRHTEKRACSEWVVLILVVMGVAGQREIVRAQSWARPSELRAKKLIDTGLYTQWSNPAVNTRSLAEHPEFTSTHPFDGIAVRALLDAKWCQEQGLKSDPNDPPQNQAPYLDSLAWSTKAIPYSAVQPAIADLKRVQWGSLTDNFLWYQFRDAGGSAPVDITQEGDWAAVQHNAVMAARICREAKLKGILFDTEQYGYAPLKKGTPALRRQRGRQWIEAVQAEYPAVKVMFTFAWCSDLDNTDFLAGLRDFLNGILDGIQQPARLINAYENTFYYGHIPGSRHTKDGFRGDRARYDSARKSIKNWRGLGTSPEKYDRYVQVGMAAWLESDPWNLTPGWPSGHNHTVWSNVPLALATSDEYVWCWSEHTGYLATLNHPDTLLRHGPGPNPFLASLTNQTFNTGRERVRSLTEDFFDDPLRRGWYFDFDILEVGRKFDQPISVPIFSRAAVPYVWSSKDRAVRIQGVWMTGEQGDEVASFGKQRRRYVHPIWPVRAKNDSFRAELDFQIENFGSDPANRIVLGLFHSDQPTDRQSLSLQIQNAQSVTISLAGDHGRWASDSGKGLTTGVVYRVAFAYDAELGKLRATVTDLSNASLVCELAGGVPGRVGEFRFDEVGAAMWDAEATTTPLEKTYKYLLQRVRFDAVARERK